MAEQFRRTTGFGGVFFRCKDPKALREWYNQHLGVDTNDFGATFEWGKGSGEMVWGTFKEDSKYFSPSEKQFMFNFRVENLVWLIDQLKSEGIETLGPVAEYEYGKFAHIMDLEGNKIELWEPAEK